MTELIQLGPTLDRVLARYSDQITLRDLAQRACHLGGKLTEQQLWEFCQGKPIRTDTLEICLRALPAEIRQAFWLESLQEQPDLLRWVIFTLPTDQLLERAAERVSQERRILELSQLIRS